ncbi:MAG: uroporphyrinogen decarboxylase family protein [Thermodesulfobacteriota bacterium]
MNSVQRVSATLQGKPVDRRALCLVLSLYGARLIGAPLMKYYTDPETYARGQTSVLETFHPDILLGPFALPFQGEVFGSSVRFFDHQAPNLARPVITSAREINGLAAPDIDSHPRLLFIREAIRLMAARHGKEIPIAAIALDPVSLPAMIMGLDGWLDTLLLDKEGTGRMLELTLPCFVQWANALLADGANLMVLPVSVVNPSIITRKIAVELAIPVLKDAFSQVQGPIVIHSGGAPIVPYLDLFADLPKVVGFVLDIRESFAEARRRIGSEFTLIGNIEGPTLYKRQGEDIKAECRGVLLDRRNDRHFILGTSTADIALDTPPENIHVFRRAVDEVA